MRDGRRDKIAGYFLCALVYKLIKRVLSVGAGFSPNYRPGMVIDGFAIAIYVFPVALHIPLLKIGRETVQVLVVRENGFRGHVVKIAVPDADHGHQNWNVLFKWLFPEMPVCRMRPIQQSFKMCKADGQGDG